MRKLLSWVLITSVLLSLVSVVQGETMYSLSQSAELKELIQLDSQKDSKRIKEIANNIKGEAIELYLVTAYAEHFRKYNTRFNYLLYAVVGDQIMLTGPSFMFKNVNYSELKLTGSNKPESFDIGLFCKVKAKVLGIENGFILLEPLSIEVVSSETASVESKKANETAIQTEGQNTNSKRNISGFNPKTNQTISWGGIDFSFSSYFNILEEIDPDTYIYYYPEEKEYYASLMFQCQDFSGSLKEFQTSLPGIIEYTFYSGELLNNIEILNSEAIEIAGLSGWTVAYTTDMKPNGKFSSARYSIVFNPAEEKILLLTCIFDSDDQSQYDYLGDYQKMLENAKLSGEEFDIVSKEETQSNSIYDFAFARHMNGYSLYLLFDTDGKIVRNFSTSDQGVMVGSIKGDLSSGITITYDYGEKWTETFKSKNNSQTEAVLIDSFNDSYDYQQVSVSEAEDQLSKDGYYDM